jgi:hypothetical protein
MKVSEGKWGVHHGIHRGTLMSRDSGYREYDSREEAIEDFERARQDYVSFGYLTWFAYLIDDQGNQTSLDVPVPYR